MSFTVANGHPPFVADSPPCWAYAGWLRFMVLQAEEMGAIEPRWHYVFESLSAGHVLDKPLPQTDLTGAHEGGERAMKILRRWSEKLSGRRSAWEQIRLVMEFLAWGFGVIDKPPELDADEEKALYLAINSKDLLDLYKRPCDLFGRVLSENIGKGWNPGAFFPTPDSVVACMVAMTMHDTKDVDQRGLTVCDPCCGTGRMLVHAGQKSMRIFGMDIDYMMVLATKINLAFWCPWGLFDWSDEFFGIVGKPKRQLALFNKTITIDEKNKGRPRAEVQMEAAFNGQMGLFNAGRWG